MRHKLATFLWGCALSFAVSFGAVGCIVTAFDMAVDMAAAGLWCAAAAVIGSICYSLPLGLLPASAFSLICGLLWQQGTLETSFQSLLYRLSRQYHRAYEWGILKLNHLTADDMELQLWLSLYMMGVLIALGVSWSVCRKKPSFVGTLPAVAMLCACLVVTDTVPHAGYLYALLFGILMLLLTNTVRCQEQSRGNRLCGLLCLPVALALLVLFALVPQKRYQGTELPRSLMDAFLANETVAELFGRASEVGTTGSSVDSSIVNLEMVGVRLESQAEVLQVLTDFDARLYLRGRALDSYDGKSWTDSGTATSALYWPDSDLLASGGEVMITTRYAHRMLYLPYYVQSTDLTDVTKGLENTKKLSQYSFSCQPLAAEDPTYASCISPDYVSQDMDFAPYLHLDKSVEKWAQPLAQELTAGYSNVYEQAQAIGEYVRNSASYDTNTYRMPSGSGDFVRWFLKDSDTGYCVHFASAATVLLQAAGIPARYVTGYTAKATSSHLTVVRAKDAHAWAEYWLPGYGWVILEATPPDRRDDTVGETTSPTAPSAPEQTQPAQTTEQTPPATDKPAAPQTPGQTTGLWSLWLVVCLTVAIVLVAAQRSIRLRLRRKRLRSGDRNEQALQHWQEAVSLARLLGETPDRSLFDLAQKARFSQHTITDEELQPFRDYLLSARSRLKKRSLFHQIYYRLILAVY